MSYDRWLKAEDIPVVRRLDYIVENTDGFESGKLYAALRKMLTLLDYLSDYEDEQVLSEEFEESKRFEIPKLEWVNKWMTDHGKDVIFTDLNSYRAIGRDYSYFWCLRTKKRFIAEEAEARLGLSDRKPVKNKLGKYEECVQAVVAEALQADAMPTEQRILELMEIHIPD